MGKGQKARVDFGSHLNQIILAKIFLTDGTETERPFVNQLLSVRQVGAPIETSKNISCLIIYRWG